MYYVVSYSISMKFDGTLIAIREPMKAALTEWKGRISPVFDVSGTVRIMDSDGCQQTVSIASDLPHGKLLFLKERQIDVLICGAISRRVREEAEALGIRVYSFVSGEIDDVWKAWKNGHLNNACYSMPGCRRCRRRRGHVN